MLMEQATAVRKEWSAVCDSVIHDKPKFIKRARDKMWFSNLEIMSEILSAYHFTADRYIENDGSVTLSLNEIDLAENENEVEENFKNSGARKKYCYSLYQKGKIYSVHLRGDGLESRDWPNIAEAFRFMLDNDGPYLVHCRLGRDRAGIFSMLCSALAGASIEDLRKDYLQTFCNYYHIKPQSYEYEILRKFKADKIIYYIAIALVLDSINGG